MDHFIANILLAVGLITTPLSGYEVLGVTENFIIEVDLNSINVASKPLGAEVKATMKRTLILGIAVPGKKKLGSYFVDQTVAKCAVDSFAITSSVLHSMDGEVLATTSKGAEYPNPNVEDNFITRYMGIVCNKPRKGGKVLVV